MQWRVEMRRWQGGGWQWDLTNDQGGVLPYRTSAEGHGLWALRPPERGRSPWQWVVIDPHAIWPAGDRRAMRRAILRHHGIG